MFYVALEWSKQAVARLGMRAEAVVEGRHLRGPEHRTGVSNLWPLECSMHVQVPRSGETWTGPCWPCFQLVKSGGRNGGYKDM